MDKIDDSWINSIPPGKYTTMHILKIANPATKYSRVLLVLKRLKVEKKSNFVRNEFLWNWLGAEHYLKKDGVWKKKTY